MGCQKPFPYLGRLQQAFVCLCIPRWLDLLHPRDPQMQMHQSSFSQAVMTSSSPVWSLSNPCCQHYHPSSRLSTFSSDDRTGLSVSGARTTSAGIHTVGSVLNSRLWNITSCHMSCSVIISSMMSRYPDFLVLWYPEVCPLCCPDVLTPRLSPSPLPPSPSLSWEQGNLIHPGKIGSPSTSGQEEKWAVLTAN